MTHGQQSPSGLDRLLDRLYESEVRLSACVAGRPASGDPSLSDGQLLGEIGRALNDALTGLIAHLALLRLPKGDPNSDHLNEIEDLACRAADLSAKLVSVLPDSSVEKSNTSGRGDGQAMPKGGVVFIVDDEPMIRELGKRVLSLQGFEVHTAANGDEALEAFDRHADRIALVVLDTAMPWQGGRDILGELAQRAPSIRVVLSSGFANSAAMIGMKQVRGVLPKPYRPSQLLEAVRAALAAT
ncbi:MAG: response regulator [Gemmataceae bacterium]